MRRELVFSVLRKLLILGLTVSAGLLLLRTDYFTAGRRRLEAQTVETEEADVPDAGLTALLLPRSMLVCETDGSVAVLAYRGTATEDAFRRFSALLGEALGSAAPPEALPEQDFRDSLGNGALALDLGDPCPLALLSDWLGNGGGGAADRSADLLCLCPEEKGVALLFRDGNGDYYRCATAAQREALTSRLREFQGDEGSFAWENPLLEGIDPYLAVLDQLPGLYRAASVPAGDQADRVLLSEAVGMNSHVVTAYYDAEGALVLNEDRGILRLSRDGVLNYRSNGTEAEFPDRDLSAAVSAAGRLVLRSAGRLCGAAQLRFSGAEPTGTGGFRVCFDYSLEGVPVRLTEGHGAEILVEGGAVRQARVVLRRYSLLSEPEILLPMLQACAVAAAGEGGQPRLVYLEGGEGLRCVWVND